MTDLSPTRLIWKNFRAQKNVRWSLRILYVFIFIAVFGDFIANEKPLYCKYGGQTYFPALRSYGVGLGLSSWEEPFLFVTDWRTLEYEKVAFAPIPYSPETIDFKNNGFVCPTCDQRLPSPRFRHWLGTDILGRDVAAGLVGGARVAILVGILSMGIATFLGIFLGSLAGFFGDNALKVPWIRLILVFLFTGLGFFWGFASRAGVLAQAAEKGTMVGALFICLLILLSTI